MHLLTKFPAYKKLVLASTRGDSQHASDFSDSNDSDRSSMSGDDEEERNSSEGEVRV